MRVTKSVRGAMYVSGHCQNETYYVHIYVGNSGLSYYVCTRGNLQNDLQNDSLCVSGDPLRANSELNMCISSRNSTC